MLQIVKVGSYRNGLSNVECNTYISALTTADQKIDLSSNVTVSSPTANSPKGSSMIMVISSTDNDSNNTIFDYKTTRMKITNSRYYTCNNCGCSISSNQLQTLKSREAYECSLCQDIITTNDSGYVCGNCHFVFCGDCAFVVSIFNTNTKDNFRLFMRNGEFITLLRNDTKIVTKV